MRNFDSRERGILIVTCFGHFLSHLNMLVFPALVLPLSNMMHKDMASVLGISFWMYLLFGITSLPWGLAADRWGPKPLFLIFFLGSGLSSLAAAVWIDSPVRLSAALAALGLFSGIYHPIGLGMISKGVSRVSLALGYNGVFGNAGLFAAPLLAGLMNLLWGPRSAYLLLGIVNLFGVLLLFQVRLSESKPGKNVPDTQPNGMHVAFFVLLMAMMMGGLAYRGSTVVLPAYFEIQNQGIFQWLSTLTGWEISKNFIATASVSLVYLVGMLGQYIGGRLAERYDARFCYLGFYSVTVPAAFLMARTTNVPLLAVSIVFFFFLLGMQPIENTLVGRFTSERFRHSAFGLKFVLTFGVGALAVKIVEAMQVKSGMEAVFVGMGWLCSLLVGVILFLIALTTARERP